MHNEEAKIWEILDTIQDPEIPVLSITDLGIIRSVEIIDGKVPIQKQIIIQYTPTYSACPAVDMINMEIKAKLISEGFNNIILQQKLSPAWTTDWMSESVKIKLANYGIAAPISKSCDQVSLADTTISCPQCGSKNSSLISEFSSTACKALFKCNNCLEPFDYFKCH